MLTNFNLMTNFNLNFRTTFQLQSIFCFYEIQRIDQRNIYAIFLVQKHIINYEKH